MAQRRKVRTELTEEQMQEIREVFETFDSDGSGAIDVSEMRYAMNILMPEVKNSLEDIEQIMDKLDSSGNKEIEFSEFLAFMRPKILEQDNSKMVDEQFENFADSCLEHRNAEECNHQPEDCKKVITWLGLKNISEVIQAGCTDLELKEIIRYCSESEDENAQYLTRDQFKSICKYMQLY
ncbi:hypothetical protein GUITHDRAFT_106665 [Guillardia theta CCMP2712]|uniref:EF-hand domain-containing protein n=1 Tax=Guillardia theta (strain CCMP2712) TaxID=905079 RepID=L1JH65_GUITC|nr:hypothetical protein GUITHDRAFT_106665 [Guillardia theta CCMP2712]EKX47677.1 hypothetical protein GUITHDRAFT_106665 [Guillardia theta CCMP2712]|eukprot:XP_005834657.1 hypothetical protein GUITHDRAFT_106665 [Guillardia theta CCMP2712]